MEAKTGKEKGQKETLLKDSQKEHRHKESSRSKSVDKNKSDDSTIIRDNSNDDAKGAEVPSKAGAISTLSVAKKPRSKRGETSSSTAKMKSEEIKEPVKETSKDIPPKEEKEALKNESFDASSLVLVLDEDKDDEIRNGSGSPKDKAKAPINTRSEKAKDSESGSDSDTLDYLEDDGNTSKGGAIAAVPRKKKPEKEKAKLTKTVKAPSISKEQIEAAAKKARGLKRGDFFLIERDFKEGLTLKFDPTVPPPLAHIIDTDKFASTIAMVNEKFSKTETVSCGSVTESLLGCLTCFVYNAFSSSHYEKVVESVEDLIDLDNESYYESKGVRILYPRRSGYLNMKIVVLKDLPSA